MRQKLWVMAWLWLALGGATLGRADVLEIRRTPPPTEAAQAKALELIKSVFKNEYAKKAPADRAALARRLLQEAGTTQDDAAARYVLLDQATELAAGAGDAGTALQAIGLQSRYILMEPLELKIKALLRAGTVASTVGAQEAIVRLAAETMDEAAVVDLFDAAQQMANLAEGAATRTQKMALLTALQPRLTAFRSLLAEFGLVQEAKEKLKTTPDDPVAHLTIGKFYCFGKGQWDLGLSHLAKSGDPAWDGWATKELAAPTDPLQQVALADGWWDAGEKLTGLAKTHVQDHAKAWYQKASVGLTGLTLTRIHARVKTGPAGAGAAGATTEPAAVDMLALIDVSKDAVAGEWKLTDGKLLCDASRNARVQIPYLPPEEYDFRIVFTRKSGDGPVVQLLVGKGEAFGWAMDAMGHNARFERVAGKIAADNPTKVACTLDNGRQYTAVVKVRKNSVQGWLDGKLLAEWKTDYKDLSRYMLWKLKNEKLLGVGSGSSETIFHKVEVVEVTGTGRKER